MAGITLAQAEAKLTAALSAYESALNNQSYSIGGRSLSRQAIASLQSAVKYWDAKVKELSGEQEVGFNEIGFFNG
jgi:hypothetical protein